MTETFAEVFAQAVHRRGLGLERLASRLAAEGVPVSVATLSYWQSGRSVPTRTRSQRAVEAMETILEVPPGTLTERTSHFLRSTEGSWHDRLPSDTARQILSEMGYPRTSMGMHAISTHDRLQLGRQGEEVSQRCNSVMKIDRPVSGWPTFFQLDSDTDVLISITDMVNCRLGEHVTIPDMGLFVGELLFHEPMPPGAVVATGYTVTWEGATQPSDGFTRGISRGLRSATMQAQFHPGVVPSEVRAWWRPTFDSEDSDSIDHGPVPIYDGMATFSTDSFEPGTANLAWEF